MKTVVIVSVIVIVLLVFFWFAFKKFSQNSSVESGDGSENKTNNSSQGLDFWFDFFAGGSITGKTFKINVSNSQIIYQEFDPGDADNPTKKIERELLKSELDEIIDFVIKNNFININTQDLNKVFQGRDQGSYVVSLKLDGKSNKLQCVITPDQYLDTLDPKSRDFQEKMNVLIGKLNKILEVKMH